MSELITQAKAATGLSYELLAGELRAAGVEVSSRSLQRWHRGELPAPNSISFIADALRKITETPDA